MGRAGNHVQLVQLGGTSASRRAAVATIRESALLRFAGLRLESRPEPLFANQLRFIQPNSAVYILA